jgi:hypothetical protein
MRKFLVSSYVVSFAIEGSTWTLTNLGVLSGGDDMLGVVLGVAQWQ